MDRLTYPMPTVEGRAVTLHAEHASTSHGVATVLVRSDMDGTDPEWRFVMRDPSTGRWNWAPVVTTRPNPSWEPSAHIPGPHNPSPSMSQWLDNALAILQQEPEQ